MGAARNWWLGGLLMMMSASLPAEEISLAGPWLFARDASDEGLAAGWASPEFDAGAWETREVPGDWGAFDGIGWYRREVDLPGELGGRRLYLVFDGVDDVSRVWVDGVLVAHCETWNRRFFVDLTRLAGRRVTVTVRVVDLGMGGGIWRPVRLVLATEEAEVLEGPLHRAAIHASPAWLPGCEIYSVFVRNFSERGDFEGLRQRVPELRALGVDILWLMPIHPIGEVDRKGTVGSPYAIRDHMAINPDFGTGEDLRALVRTVHEHGMRIIIDAVLNHSSPDAPLTETHPDWYVLDEEGRPRAENADWWDVVDFDWSNREVWDYFLGVLEHWVREFDIDGYRCDVASLMPTEFWEEARRRLEALKPDIVMLAESDDPALHVVAFDLSYNWTLYDAMEAVFAGDLPATALRDAALQDRFTFPRGALRMAFAENHDKERAVNVFGGAAQARLAALIALTECPCPLLYNGQEVGDDQPRDIFERVPIDWSDPEGMRPFFARVLGLRASSEALRRGDLRVIEAQPEDRVFAFARAVSEERAVVVANLSDRPVSVQGADLRRALGGAEERGALGVGRVDAARGRVDLPAWGGEVWVIRGAEHGEGGER